MEKFQLKLTPEQNEYILGLKGSKRNAQEYYRV